MPFDRPTSAGSPTRAASGRPCWFPLQARLKHFSPSDGIQPPVVSCQDFWQVSAGGLTMKWTVAIVAVVASVIGLCRVEDVRAATDNAVCAKVISHNEIANRLIQ
jgi:hypothetical protein